MRTDNAGGDDAGRDHPCALTDAMWEVVAGHLPVRDRRGSGRPLKKTRGRKRHLLVCVVHSASVQDRAGAKPVLYSIDEQRPSIGLIWVDGGYASVVDAGLIGWADHELGVRLDVVKRSDDVKGVHVLPRRWVVERISG